MSLRRDRCGAEEPWPAGGRRGADPVSRSSRSPRLDSSGSRRTGRIRGTDDTPEDHPDSSPESAKKENQRDTLRSLGLKRIGDVVMKEDRPEIRGMVATVPHLVSGRGGRVTWRTAKVHHLRPAPGAQTEKTRVGRGGKLVQGQDGRSRYEGHRSTEDTPRRTSRAGRCRCTCGCRSSGFANRSASSTRWSTWPARRPLPRRRRGRPRDLVAKGRCATAGRSRCSATVEATAALQVSAHGFSATARRRSRRPPGHSIAALRTRWSLAGHAAPGSAAGGLLR